MRKIREKKQPGIFSSGWQRLWRMVLIGCLGTLCIYPVFGQEYTKVISLKVENATVLETLKEINMLSDNCVNYKREEVEKERKSVTLSMNATVLEIVKACLSGTKLNCITQKNLILVVPVKEKEQTLKSRRVKGVVKDESGTPLPGVTVRVQGASIAFAATTNIDGVYDMLLPDIAEELVFSFVGLKTKIVKIENRSVLNVVLEEDIQSMDEVVVRVHQRVVDVHRFV